VTATEPVFPLVLRRRLIGLPFGATLSARRGLGSDVAGTRPYRPGDDMRLIDWAASARLSSARALDEFVVREHFAEEAPRVVVVCDRRPAMALYAPELPWLSKPEAMRVATSLIFESAARVHGAVGYLDFAAGEQEPFWRPPTTRRLEEGHLARAGFAAPEDNLTRAFEHLGRQRGILPAGSFAFVLSDFLVRPPDDVWLAAIDRRWDVVPVVVQDPTWEASFPAVGGLLLSLADAATGRVARVRLTAAEATARREASEARLEALLSGFRGLGVDPVLVSSAEPETVLAAFLGWAEQRVVERRAGW